LGGIELGSNGPRHHQIEHLAAHCGLDPAVSTTAARTQDPDVLQRFDDEITSVMDQTPSTSSPGSTCTLVLKRLNETGPINVLRGCMARRRVHPSR
jgi:hypothetical protein